MHRATVIAAGLLVLLASGGPALAEFGAFALDQASGKYGLSWNEKTQKQADEAALKGCPSEKCKIVFRTHAGQCGAIALTEDGKIWGGAARPKRDAAQLAALENCQKRTEAQCKLRGAECNR